jgi:NADH-quinone oxidoreductase subunit C
MAAPDDLTPKLRSLSTNLAARFGDKLAEESRFRGELTYRVAAEDWVDVLEACKSTHELAFDQLDSLTGDHLPERMAAPFEVIAHLVSHLKGWRVRIKTALAEGQPLGTITSVWPSAGFDERETWEMYGIVFSGHPDLRRLLTVPDFEGFPQRKDFPLQGTVGGRIRTDLRGKI